MEKHLQNNLFSLDQIIRAWKLFAQANTITLLTHSRPDADGISACAALSYVACIMGKSVETIYPTKSELPIKRHGANVRINTHTLTPDLLIVCDTANYERFYYPQEFHEIPLINIDHHISNSINGTINFIKPESSSTCEMLTIILETWNSSWFDSYLAECLLMGILYDTQIFRIPSTTAETLRVAAMLMEYGASLFNLKTELLSHKNPAIISLWAKVLKSIEIIPEINTAIAHVKKEYMVDNCAPSSLIGFNNFLSEISDVDVTLLIYDAEDGTTKVSLRSKVADVNALAHVYGGGGHKHASGIATDEKPKKVIDTLIRKLQEKPRAKK